MGKIKTSDGVAGKYFKTGNGYFITCCDCGLVHRLGFKVGFNKDGEPVEVFMRAWRNEKMTEEQRKLKRYKIKK